ncbi:rhomboid family intramembrane serine protease [Agrilactobacillus yilanensis]|uniref:Rhomboid family intramembrane serine protease n=1 Tax=Agrilactobacillus yilanensis TaxID=2485997 RepID=A0ABW4J8U5_9LACO|nr:rhomboid family intramembrane serine protease [Agrilactobacillus yilanensis]
MIQNRLRRIDNTAFMTWTMLGLAVVMFILEVFSGGSQNISVLVRYGAKVNYLVAQGDWWRLITPIFLHVGFLHIAVNGVMIYYVGTQIEHIFGHTRFLVIFILSGIFGNLASFAFGSDNSVSAGASTALFGLFGAFIMLGLSFKHNPFIQTVAKQFGVLVLVNLVFDLFANNIDIWGHIGGFIGGVLIAFCLGVPKRFGNISKIYQILAIILVLLLSIVLYWIGLNG